ncbi:MAG TPA: peptidylprolyl isomerase [Bacteroidia bacterium]|jgi:cyclophilin family peptidyl-prolyl cis-trans isomerase|nr:peptidylprolyl isomerase [Bacteroidia bacterium]
MKFLLKVKILFFLLIFLNLGLSLVKAQISSIYADSSKTALILIETKYGPIKIRLFNQTPLHRDMFLKLAAAGFYDSLLFHRVIDGFMIQGGDPDSRRAKPGQLLGDGDVIEWERFDFNTQIFPFPFLFIPHYAWIMPEINKDIFHKRGMLAAARESDDKNPLKKSSACQFYITQGRGPLTDRDLKLYEYRINRPLRNQLKDSILNLAANAIMKKNYENYKKEKKNDSLTITEKILDSLITPSYEKKTHYTFSDEQKRAYKKIGGTPHLDGNYTVYGEVIYGMEIVDTIAKVGTDKNDRPDFDLRMKIIVLRKPKN